MLGLGLEDKFFWPWHSRGLGNEGFGLFLVVNGLVPCGLVNLGVSRLML